MNQERQTPNPIYTVLLAMNTALMAGISIGMLWNLFPSSIGMQGYVLLLGVNLLLLAGQLLILLPLYVFHRKYLQIGYGDSLMIWLGVSIVAAGPPTFRSSAAEALIVTFQP